MGQQDTFSWNTFYKNVFFAQVQTKTQGNSDRMKGRMKDRKSDREEHGQREKKKYFIGD